MKNRLDDLRKEIDLINYRLLELLNQRTALVKEVITVKDEGNMDYFDPLREQEMLKNIIAHNQGPLTNELVKEVFSSIFISSVRFMGADKEKRLLVSARQNQSFQTIREMFDLPDDEPIIIAGPCAVENIEYLEEIGALLKKKNVRFLRAGAYKPRTSPYDFQGLKEEGLKMLHEVGKKYGLITVTEVVDCRDVETVAQYADVLQIGARNMQNFELLKEAGHSSKPILLKRGISATIQELIFAAEYIALRGNRKTILCERGIRTFETKTRNTLDISAIPIIKRETSLPIIVDISHSLGRKDVANPIAKAALAAGADGIMVEVHPQPELALSDSKQQLNPKEFCELIEFLKK